jgi:hypothetical protein
LSADAGDPLGYNFQKAYEIINLTGWVSPPSGALRIGFYVNNLTIAIYLSSVDTPQYG